MIFGKTNTIMSSLKIKLNLKKKFYINNVVIVSSGHQRD